MYPTVICSLAAVVDADMRMNIWRRFECSNMSPKEYYSVLIQVNPLDRKRGRSSLPDPWPDAQGPTRG